MVFKKCVVPACRNTTDRAPTKHFLHIPTQAEISTVSSNTPVVAQKNTTKNDLYNTPLSSSASSGSDEQKLTENSTKEATVVSIDVNSRFYLGLPKNVYCLVSYLISKTKLLKMSILITLKKIRFDDVYEKLAIDFGMSISGVMRIFRHSVSILAKVLQELIVWQSQEANCTETSLVDCFEIKTQNASDKKCHTIKYLIACAPNGTINFISKGFGGRAIAQIIVEESKMLNELPENVSAMADIGFNHVFGMLAQKQITLIQPSSISVNVKSTKDQVSDATIVLFRIHIERVIGRLREFKILNPHSFIDSNLWELMDKIVVICCALINIQETLIKDN